MEETLRGRTATRSRLSWQAPLFAGLIFLGGCLMHHAAAGDVVDRALITESEIDSVHAGSALEAISMLRPMFLMSRGKLNVDPGTPPALPNIYVDNQFYGDATVLRNISAATIESIRFYSASEAQFKFGRGNEAGVIGIFTKH
jgi:hypothetical protein